jgi:hypothetical protein
MAVKGLKMDANLTIDFINIIVLEVPFRVLTTQLKYPKVKKKTHAHQT